MRSCADMVGAISFAPPQAGSSAVRRGGSNIVASVSAARPRGSDQTTAHAVEVGSVEVSMRGVGELLAQPSSRSSRTACGCEIDSDPSARGAIALRRDGIRCRRSCGWRGFGGPQFPPPTIRTFMRAWLSGVSRSRPVPPAAALAVEGLEPYVGHHHGIAFQLMNPRLGCCNVVSTETTIPVSSGLSAS